MIALAYTYSSGDRTGYIQKFSEKGWLCKTYEGEIAMVNLPGQIANTFQFTVRDDSIANLINQVPGQARRAELRAAQGPADVVFRRDGVFRQWDTCDRTVASSPSQYWGRRYVSPDQKTLIKVESASYCSAGRPLLLCAALTDDLGGESET